MGGRRYQNSALWSGREQLENNGECIRLASPWRAPETCQGTVHRCHHGISLALIEIITLDHTCFLVGFIHRDTVAKAQESMLDDTELSRICDKVI